ncbi:T9SS type A sorting domain-containing protein [Persicitalea jodogahamensis]|uniref:Secretion system C-terminal sorting domain-containing protein n=1 Tax=Persicitalea jodogahamensis TaxID=402147 RepID=A0A8J3D8Y5_9BACT|nr:T9SS type A sorting domain-containing protein [Persicitalea jodogahamensis]GHB70058.1 hypothetical protein GCM10007390_24600 [Persicitalea jodogahamensis]
MKKTLVRTALFSLTLAYALGTAATAQSKSNENDNKKTNIRIEVIGKADGKTQVVERSYRVDAMTENEQKEFIDKALDSLAVDGMSQKRISITVDDNENRMRRRDGDLRIRGWGNNSDEPMILSWRDNNGNRRPSEFHFDTRELEGSVRRMQKDLEPKLRELRANVEPNIRIMERKMEGMSDRFGDVWGNSFSNSSTVRSLNAYANNPDNGMLNLRFSVPDQGDVRITVTDTDGKEVGRKTIKDFSGEFVGQIELKKNTKGTLFVTVVQNEDGTVRKVVIK